MLKTGDVMSGPLVVSSEVSASSLSNLVVVVPEVDFAEAPEATVYPNIEFRDKNSQRMGRVEYTYKSDGSHYIGIIDKKDSTTATYAAVTVGFNASGNPICSFPMCTTKATTTSSAATNRVAVIKQNYKSGYSWYRIWSDGWIEQGGYSTVNGDIALLYNFTTTNYSVLLTTASDTTNANYFNLSANSRTTSKFNVYTTGHGTTFFWYACGY